MEAPAQLAHHVLHAAGKLLFRPDAVWPIVATVFGVNARWLRKGKRIARKRTITRSVRGWMTVPAVIDVVSVSEQIDSDGKKCYLAALTYFYRHPALEMGEYQREFVQKTAAQNWIKQFKGRQVMVHVNPKNIAESYLLDGNLEGLESRRADHVEAPEQPEPAPQLPHRIRFLSALGEQLSVSGLAASAVLLLLSLARGGVTCPGWILWTGGAVLLIAFVLEIVVESQCRGDESIKQFLRSLKLWSPAWIRWSLRVSAAVFGLLWLAELIHADLPLAVQLWMKALVPHLPYFFACMGFLITASFHAAILRSQEQPRLPVTST